MPTRKTVCWLRFADRALPADTRAATAPASVATDLARARGARGTARPMGDVGDRHRVGLDVSTGSPELRGPLVGALGPTTRSVTPGAGGGVGARFWTHDPAQVATCRRLP